METKKASKSQVSGTDLHFVSTHKINSKFNSNQKPMFMKKLITLFAVFFCLNSNAQIITTFAGTGTSGYSGDGGQAILATFNGPVSVTTDNSGNKYIADQSNNVIRKISTSGIISTVAGNGNFGYLGDGGQATSGRLASPASVVFDAAGNMYIAEQASNVIRKVTPAGIMSTIAGSASAGSYSGDGGQATDARLYYPTGLAFDGGGNLYISELFNQVIRKIDMSTGIITTIAGSGGNSGYSGDGGPATAALLSRPDGIDIDAQGNIYVADSYNHRVRKINTSGIISTIAGTGNNEYTGDGGPATSATLNTPSGVTIDGTGNIYIADALNDAIRKINTAGIMSTIAGNGTAGYSGDGGPATSAQLNLPYSVRLSIDESDNLYLSDYGNNVIRKVGLTPTVTLGSSSSNPILVNNVTNQTGNSFSGKINLNTIWFSFTAQNDSTAIRIINSNQNKNDDYPLLNIYSGSTNNLILVTSYNALSGSSSDSMYQALTKNLAVGQTYFIELTRKQASNDLSTLSLRVFPYQKVQGDGGTDQTFCFLAGGPFNNPPIFTMYSCAGDPTPGCTYSQTGLAITCSDDGGGNGGNLSFDVLLTSYDGTHCSIPVSGSINGSYSSGTIFQFSSQSCLGDNFNVTITNIHWSGSAATLKFDFYVGNVYSCGDDEQCSDVEVDFVFNDAAVYINQIATTSISKCPNQQASIQIKGLDGQDDQTNHYTFDWTRLTTPSGNAGNGNPFSTATAGTYEVTIGTAHQYYNNSGCNETIHNIIITNLPAPIASVSPNTTQTICDGSQITLYGSASGGNGQPYTYQWSGGSNSTSQNITVGPATNTTYNVTVKDKDGCASSSPAAVTVDVKPAIDFSVAASTQFLCLNSPVTLTVTGPSSYTYIWTTSNGTYIGTGQSIQDSPLNTTTYVCSVTANGCTANQNITVTVLHPTPAEISVPYAFQCEGANDVVTISTPANIFYQSFSWLADNGATVVSHGSSVDVNCANATGDVTLILTTVSEGCTTKTSIPIKQCCKAGRSTLTHVVENIGAPSDPINPTYTYIQNANITKPYPAAITTYYVTGNLYFEGNSTINDVNFIMNPGSSITVDAGATLNIINSHIYACTDMWQGINFNVFYSHNTGTSQVPTLNVTNSLIEDAITGVNIAYSSFVKSNFLPSATQPVVNLNNAWFNRCTIGVLADYDPIHPDSTTNAANNFTSNKPQYFNGGVITATNSVFSCLNGITMTRVANQNYNTTALATDLLHNYLLHPNFYSFCGIVANSSSLVNSTINSCYFDNLMDGIVSYDNPDQSGTDLYTTPTSNLNVTSCSFQRTHLDDNSENFNLINNFAYAKSGYPNNYFRGGAYYYPYATNNYAFTTLNGSTGAGINFLGSQLNVGGSTATSCTFKNSDYGILGFTDGGSPVTISTNNFSGTTKSGIYMSDANGDIGQPISIISNTFKDHFQQGVNLKFLSLYDNSSIGVTGNNFTISAGNNSYWQSFYQNPATYIYAPEAIWVTSFGQASFKGGSDTYETFNISNNTIHGYEKGIRGSTAYYTNIQENTIDGIPDDANSNYSYGISLTNCDYSTVTFNTVKAEFGNGTPWNYNQFGVFTENSTNSQILCNDINGPDVSLKCQGSNNVCNIEGNTLNNAAPVNFWLDVNGFVGIQGAANFGSANKFGLDNIYGTNLYAGHGSNNPQSPSAFYYINSGNQRPLTSGSDYPTFPSTAIPIGGVYALPTRDFYFKCNFGKIGPPPIITEPVSNKIALDSVQFTSNNTTAMYGNQKDLYRALIDTGAAFYNADPVLSAYMANMVGSSHEKLLATDTLLANAGTDSSKINHAISINNSFSPTGNFDTYLQKINNLYAAYKKAKKHLNMAQIQAVRSIAMLCPFGYGEGVYKARALLSLYDTINYVNPCEIFTPPNITNGSSNRIAAIENTVVNELNVTVYPNPANNTIYMQGLQLKENDKAEIVIYSSMGQLVLKTEYNKAMQAADITNIDISSLNSGSYMYKVLLNGMVMQLDKLIIIK
jgi:hypothetical protein